jgi:hypothetical protein
MATDAGIENYVIREKNKTFCILQIDWHLSLVSRYGIRFSFAVFVTYLIQTKQKISFLVKLFENLDAEARICKFLILINNKKNGKIIT